ncbi:MAG: M14 family zinc carboxypeptidase [bacterium]|nr:M14 family zinc carboxypeptidase [bacterium]
MINIKQGLLLFVYLLSISFAWATINEKLLIGTKRYRFYADHKLIQRLELDYKGVIVDEATRFGEAVIWADPISYQQLTAAGFALEEYPEEPLPFDWWTVYPTIQQVSDSLVALAQRHPNRARVDTIGISIQNRPLVAITLGDNINQPNFQNRPTIMFIGCIHGNEKPGAPLLLNYAEFLLDSSEYHATANRIMAECRTLILPVANPDGYNAHTRGNAAGSDLNRNFPCKTTADSIDSEDGRQPETRALMRWSHQQKPLLSLNFHTGALVVNWPYDSDIDAGAAASYPPFPDKPWYQAAADSYAFYNPPMWANNGSGFRNGTVNGVAWYQAPGSLQDYHCRYVNTRHMTIELNSTSTPPATWLPTMWETNRNSILVFSSLIWQGIDLVVPNLSLQMDNLYCDVGFGTAQYLRIGNTNTFRLLLLEGSYLPRLYRPLRWSTVSINELNRVQVNRNQLMVITRNLQERNLANSGLFQVYLPNGELFGSSNFNENQYLLFQENNATWSTYSMQNLGLNLVDSVGNIAERSWLLRENIPNGSLICIPNATGDIGNSGYFNALIVSRSFNDTARFGSGDALQITTNGRQSNGLSESPVGNYGNNWNRRFYFNPFIVPTSASIGIPNTLADCFDTIPKVRVSFQYRGNMETYFDYWVVVYTINNGPNIVADTLTGIVPNWKTFYFDIPIQVPSPTIRVGIVVSTDGSVTRDGFTLDDFSVTAMYTYTTETRESDELLPHEFSIQCFPNPFNNTAKVLFTLPVYGELNIQLYDPLGRVVRNFNSGYQNAGTYGYHLNSDDLSSGVYFLRAQHNEKIKVQKIAILK